MINGEVVMKDREILKIEKRKLSQKIREESSRERTVQEKAFQEAVRKLRGYLCEYYRDWYKEIALEPYYLFNSKK